MTKRVVAFTIGLVALLMFQSAGDTQGSKDWNSAGLSPQEFKSMPQGGPAPRRDLSGVWDAGAAGVGGAAQEGEREAARAPFTPLGLEMVSRNKPGNGPPRARSPRSTIRSRRSAIPRDSRASSTSSCGPFRSCRRRPRC